VAKVFVGIGSSIERQENIRLGIQALQSIFGELSLSPIYESEAVGFTGCHFYNLVVSFNSLLSPNLIISKLKAIEIKQGRPTKAVKFAPRTLDLDLLLHDQHIDASIDLPRAEILNNAFVLLPLSELAPNLKHPIEHETYQALWDKFPKTKQKLWQIDAMIN
jgi:2-amino-4-hydroxy-6-hydroxymethyldihydropteridine diphosphokinase